MRGVSNHILILTKPEYVINIRMIPRRNKICYNTHMESAPSPADSTLNEEPQAVVVRRESERDIITWTAPARPFKRYGRKFYITVFSLVGIVGIIFFIAEGIMPVVLLISLTFLFYVLSTVQPEDVEYKVTNRGVKIAGKQTLWQNMVRFCFSQKSGVEMLVFDTVSLPGRMELVIKPELKEGLKKEISAYIPYEEISPSFLDKIVNWVIKKLPESD